MQALVSRKKIVFTRRYVFNTIIALIRPLHCLHKRINTRRITNAGIGEQEKDRVYAPLRF